MMLSLNALRVYFPMKLLLLCLCAAVVALTDAGLAPIYKSEDQRSLPDGWIVKIKDADQLDKVAEEIGSKFSEMRVRIPEMTKIRRIMSAVALRIPPFLIDHIRSLEGIEYIEQDSIETLAVSQYNPTWGLDRIDSRTGMDGYYNYKRKVQGKGVNIYIMDSGIQTTHNVFGGRAHLLFGETDDHGHGTHCAGTAAGDTYGIARKANVYSLKVCTSSGSCSLKTSLKGFDAILEHVGSGGGIISRSLSGLRNDSPSMTQAVQTMWNNGVLLVNAAGNDQTDACVYTPQKMAEAIAIGATKSDDKRAGFSNYGPCVDIFAPGVKVESAMFSTSSDSATSTKSGTSMACPHVAGACALLMGSMDNPTPQAVKDALLNNATPDVVVEANGSHNRLLYISPPGLMVASGV